MSEHLTIETIALAQCGALRADSAVGAEAHLAECPDCAQHRDLVRAVPALLSAARAIAVPVAVAARIDAVIAAEVDRRAMLHAADPPAQAQQVWPEAAGGKSTEQLSV